jgi:urea transport system permease protein
VSLFISSLFDGVSVGAVLLMSALGLAIVFGLMGVINLAHGEMMMLGAYTTYVVQNVVKGWGEPWANLYIFPALFLAFGVAAIAGLILERGVIRYLYGRPLETLLATWGVSLILRQLVRSANWGLTIGIALFSAIFFGGQWWLNRARTNRNLPTWRLVILVELLLATWSAIWMVRQFALSGNWVWIIGLFGALIFGGQSWLNRARTDENLLTRLRMILFVAAAGVSLTVGQILLGQGPQSLWGKLWFSARNIDVTPPKWLQGGLTVGASTFPYARMFIIALMIVAVLGTYAFLQRSRWGLRIRSVTQNRQMSACLGIPTDTVDALTFAIGSGLAGLAGCAVTFLGSVGPNLGGNYIVDAFMVVVVGGVGNLLGTVLAALAIGILSYLIGSGTLGLVLSGINADLFRPLIDLLNFFATSSMAKVMVFALIILFLQVRPAGIFPQKGRSVDA